MTRHQFGQGPSDWTFIVGSGNAAVLAGAVVLTMWDNPTSGTQITDLLSSTGSPITTVTTSAGTDGLPIGTVPIFYGPFGATQLWVDAGGGYRSQITAHDAYAPSDDPRFGQVAGVPVSSATGARRAVVGTSPTAAAWTEIARADLGVYAPPGWGASWRAKLAAAGAGTAVLATIGGSSTQGYYASNLRTKGWVDLLRTSLQTTYGDGGSGFRGAGLTGAVQVADGVPAAATTAYNANSSNATLSGSWSVGGNSYGPGAKYVFTSTVGDSYTVAVRGTAVDIYAVAGSSAPHTTYSYQIDGGSVVTVATTGTADNIQKTTITGLSSGSHTVVLRHAGTGGQFVAICGVTGRNTTGVIIHNFGRYGSRAANFAAADETINTSWNGSYNLPCDLAILTHGPNDAIGSDSGDTWAKNQRLIMERIRNSGGATGTTELLIMLPHVGTFDSTGLYQDYASRVRGLGEAFGAAVVSMWGIGRNSWNYWNGLGYWADATNPGASGTDNVHPSDLGHAFIASVLQPILTG